MSSSHGPLVSASSPSPARSVRSFPSLRRHSSQHSSKRPASPSRFARRDSPRGAEKHSPPSLSGPFKGPETPKVRPFHTKKSSRSKSGTILHAVPESSACATVAREMPNQDASLVHGRISPALNGPCLAHDPTLRTRRRSISAAALSPKVPSSLRSSSSSSNIRGSIGTYKDGRVSWDLKGRSPSTQRPRIQVVIPVRHTDHKPLPSIPKASSPFGNHIMSAAGSPHAVYNISPPTASKVVKIRDSLVSPLTSQQGRPSPRLQNPITVVVPKSTPNSSPDLSDGARHSSDDSRGDDRSSVYSDNTSVTSDEAGTPPPQTKAIQLHRRNKSDSYSVKSPVEAGVFDSPPLQTGVFTPPPRKTMSAKAETGHQQPTSPRRARVYGHHPATEEYVEFQPSCAIHSTRNVPNQPSPKQAAARSSPSPASSHKSLAPQPDMEATNQSLKPPVTHPLSIALPSPTLSEATSDLERQLTSFTDDNPFRWDDIKIHDIKVRQEPPLTPQGVPRKDSVTYSISRHSPPPLLPRKSSRRESQPAVEQHDGFRISNVPDEHIVSQIRRSKLQKSRDLALAIPEPPKRLPADDSNPTPLPPPAGNPDRGITSDVAESVILRILQSTECLDDLFACALINRGFYCIFKRNELDLMKAILRKESPPAWEYREICYPGHDDPHEEDLDRPRQEYTAESYIGCYNRDADIIAGIKSMIAHQCESFLRPEIAEAIISEDPAKSARVDDALWRIWTFCKIFGSGKGREEDVIAQMDWLKGGVIVHQQNCSSGALWDDMNETLASAPECFAKGNEGGLNPEELFDMMELWNCLGVLLQPIDGRTTQAREYGLFENTDIRGGDIDGEELMLDEWYYYLLTLGLSTILDLAGPCSQNDASLFLIAREIGCLDWKPPVFGGSRRNFFKEAAARVYEDKIALTYAATSTKEVQRALSKQRIQKHISELRHRQQAGGNLPYVRMSQERPMSDWEGVFKNLTRPRPPPATSNLVTHIPSLHSSGFTSALAQELSVAVSAMEAARSRPEPDSLSPPDRTVAMPLLPSPPPSTVATTRDRSSIATSIAQSPPRRIVAMPLLPSPPASTIASTRDRSSMASSMPAIEEHPAFRNEVIPEMPRLKDHPMFAQHTHARQASGDSTSAESVSSHSAFQQHPLQRMVQEHDSSENSADRAIYRIVEMGFTPEQAKRALRITDLGDGLRVDRAVELLLRGNL